MMAEAPVLAGTGIDSWTGEPYEVWQHVDRLGITRTDLVPVGDSGSTPDVSVPSGVDLTEAVAS